MGERRKRQIEKALGLYKDLSVAKLDNNKAFEIRKLLESGLTQKELSVIYGVTQQTISDVKLKKHYCSNDVMVT